MVVTSSIERPHRRYNPLSDRWLLVSPHRTMRPWQGHSEATETVRAPRHDSACPLCPRNERASGERNPDYDSVYTFTNDFPALLPERAGGSAEPAEQRGVEESPLFRNEFVAGTCRVTCFSPRHDLTMAQLDQAALVNVFEHWQQHCIELSEKYRWLQVFENKGTAMGCSNPHPHGQIWATDCLPTEIAIEDRMQRRYVTPAGKPMLLAYAEMESRDGRRVVVENDGWLSVVPYWAGWPYEIMLLPKRHIRRLTELTADDTASLADVYRRTLIRYDNLFQCKFPYSMGWHGAPFDGQQGRYWLLHAHFYPPLLRSATIRKFMVGYEMLAEAQRDLTAETAAEILRGLPDVRFDEA